MSADQYPPFVAVDWIDSHSAFDHWNGRTNFAPSDLKCHSRGFLIHKCDESITLVMTLGGRDRLERPGESGHLYMRAVGGLTIPKVSILEWWEVHDA